MIIYCCPKCKITDLGEENEVKRCMKCKTPMISLGLSTTEWNSMDHSQINEAINRCVSENSAATTGEQKSVVLEEPATEEPANSYVEQTLIPDETEVVEEPEYTTRLEEEPPMEDNEPSEYETISRQPIPKPIPQIQNRGVAPKKKVVNGNVGPVTPQPSPAKTSNVPQSAVVTGKFSSMSIIAIVLSILGCVSPLGIALGIMDLVRKDGRRRELSYAAIIVGAMMLAGSLGFVKYQQNKDKIDTNTVSALNEIEEPSPTATPTPTPTPTPEPEVEEETPEEVTEKIVANDGEIELIAGEKGEYGDILVFNEGTDHEDVHNVYHVPIGTYEVKNVGEYLAQVNIYSDETVVNEDGWEEFVNGSVEKIDVGETKQMTIEEGYHFDIDEPAHIILKKVEEDSSVEENSQEEVGDKELNPNEFCNKYATDFIVGASMTLDRYISNYDMSLAPQKWKLAKFDETDTILGTTEITYNNKKGSFQFVGTLEFNGDKVTAVKPHYIFVIDEVLGDDGYCDDYFSALNDLSQLLN